MRKFIFKILLLSLPISILLGSFLLLDPFRIIYNYDNYSKDLIVLPNRDFISSEMYLKNKDKYHYNSFIFGNSRTIAFKTKQWRKHLTPSDSPFVFDAYGESIYGIYTKIKYIDKIGAKIDNCLLILCTDFTFLPESHKGHLYIKHPTIAGSSWFEFYTTNIKDYFDAKFLKPYFKFLITQKWDTTMNGYIITRLIYDTVTNDFCWIDDENQLKENPVGYYESRKNIFYDRDSIIPPAKPQIYNKQITMLNEIKAIFIKHHTNYKVIISPLYNQISLNNKDYNIIKNIFGDDNVFNYSGKNLFTIIKENYYEVSHYRPIVGDSIMNIIYN